MQLIREIRGLSYEEFCNEALQFARNKLHLGLVDNWEKHIIFKDFHNNDDNSYFADIYMAEESYAQNTYFIVCYHIWYVSSAERLSFEEYRIYRKAIQAIIEFEKRWL